MLSCLKAKVINTNLASAYNERLSENRIDDYAKDYGKKLSYQDALRSNYDPITILKEFDQRTQCILVKSFSPPSFA